MYFASCQAKKSVLKTLQVYGKAYKIYLRNVPRFKRIVPLILKTDFRFTRKYKHLRQLVWRPFKKIEKLKKQKCRNKIGGEERRLKT